MRLLSLSDNSYYLTGIFPLMNTKPKQLLSAFLLFILFAKPVLSQDDDRIIHTKDGQSLGPKRAYIAQCKKAYGAPPDNKIIGQICECQANLLDRRFSMKQIRSYEKKYKGQALTQLIEEDSLLQRQINECSSASDNILLLSIPDYRKSFISKCVDNLKLKSLQPVNDTLAAIFCNCAATVMEKRKITLDRFEELADPSSFLYNEISYKCGSPFMRSSDFAPGWKAADTINVTGPVHIDSVAVISVLGMHKIKITIGGITKIWLLDSGASDLLISEEYAKELKDKGVLSDMNYIGEGSYSLADNSILSCRRYKINGVKIGRFVVNEVVLATSKQAKEFLLGKSILNKFSQWTLDNKFEVLILKK